MCLIIYKSLFIWLTKFALGALIFIWICGCVKKRMLARRANFCEIASFCIIDLVWSLAAVALDFSEMLIGKAGKDRKAGESNADHFFLS